MKLKFYLLVFLIGSYFSAQASDWFCTESASRREGNTYEVCGIGQDKSENLSRKKALDNAFSEFNAICSQSDDCKKKFKEVSPLRTDCELQYGQYKCYRSFSIAVDPTRSENENSKKLFVQ